MYKLLNINESAITRFLQLENLETGTIENCFDDSAVRSNDNFEFMKVGNTYDCKILLFGKFLEKKTESSVEVRIINPVVVIGKRTMLEVQVGRDTYYIPQRKAFNASINERLNFYYTRKDLIQVNDVIHADLLR